ncbi:PLP-dependent cysteine synthase family protein [Lentzea nigeriaca]|uniref:PLP-dependent cysteine synthase family protein n=1 Tax=Lentzea nigeriaca TaxID=1128665 RepID=UPI0027DCACCC|nr:cysteine synthase family protein [Lentzea nigeriaca]MBM7856383.1 cysteine synthase A [Lentzea nigeriaca]
MGTDVLTLPDSIEGLIGNTPLLRLRLPDVPETVRVLAKLEMFNPLSSVKDRPALHMLRAAEESGELDPAGGVVVEYSSGNTGIALAGLCASRGHRFILVMPDNATAERRRIVTALGGEIVQTPHQDGLPAAIAKAQEITAATPGAWLVNQAFNHVNTIAHYETTGPEIWQACGGDIDVLVSPVGTGGTLTGVARYVKERTELHVVAVEPAASPVLSGGCHSPHRIPGIGPGFVAEVTDTACIDEIVTVSDVDAGLATRTLAATTGLFVGVSSGAAVHAAHLVARRLTGGTIVAVLPDSGERYLSIWETLGVR